MELPVDSETESSVQSDETVASSPFSNRLLILAVSGAVVAGLLLAIVFFGGEDATPEPIDSDLAALAFLNADGSTGSLADYAGEPLVVNFFASWCGPCRAELPEFQEAHLANKGRITFVGISHDLDEVEWRSLVEETQVTFDTVFQPEAEIWDELDAKGMPTTAFVSAEGEVLEMWTGILSREKLQELIDENLVEA